MSEDLFSVLAAIGIIALVYRWFTTTPSTPTSSNGLNSTTSLTALQRRAINLPRAQVDRLLTMFPQLSENEVRYALVVTRGGPEAVAERVLIRGGLDPPPANFFPQPSTTTRETPNHNPSSTSSSTAAATSSQNNNKTKMNPSLITKLNLDIYKIDQDEANQLRQEWSWEESKRRIKEKNLAPSGTSNQDESQGSSSLHDRKSRMVLEARWKLLQKDKKGKSIATH